MITPVYPSLRAESIYSYCTFDFDQDLSFEPQKNNDHPCEPHDTTLMLHPFHIAMFLPISKTAIDHFTYLMFFMFPTNHYKYLPRFDGKYDNLTIEKHLQSFEHFLEHFEVEHEDVCMRAFSKSL